MKKRVVIFGRGEYCKRKINYTIDNYDVVGFLDNNTSKPVGDSDSTFTDLPVHLPHEYHKYYSDEQVIIMAAPKSIADMAMQLLTNDIPEENILFGINIGPFFTVAERELRLKGAYVEVKNGKTQIAIGHEKYVFNNNEEYITIIREHIICNNEVVDCIRHLPLEPISLSFGRDYGEPIDRYYIEQFLASNTMRIHGDVLEVADDKYTFQFGHDITSSMVMHVQGKNGALKCDLATGEGVKEDFVDCFICTQTLQMIYEISSAMKNIYKMLKKGGTALITIHGISQISMGDYLTWGEYWRITPRTAINLALEAGFSEESIEVKSFGNAKTAIGFLVGMCQELLEKKDFEYNDERYPVIISMRCVK